MKLFKLCGTRKCTSHLALVRVFNGAAERGYKRENIIDFVNDNLES